MPIIGLTGNFGMGKTTVLSLFKRSGAYTFNVDRFVHEILKQPETIKKIARELGDDVLVKRSNKISVNKSRIANIIFYDSSKRKAIEKIVHPQVLRAIKSTSATILKKDRSALIVFEVPLLFEAGYEHIFDKTIVVYCSKDKALSRLKRKGFSKADAHSRLRAQMPITRKKRLANFVINNSRDIDYTWKQIKCILSNLKQ